MLVYLAELAIRTEDRTRASAALADLEALSLTDTEHTAATAELDTAAELRAMLSASG